MIFLHSWDTYKAQSKRMKHCWPTTPNIVGSYMLCLSAYPVAGCCALLEVVAQGLKTGQTFEPTAPSISSVTAEV